MKKWLIGSIVGAILVFAWQGLSWTILGVHESGMKYTPAQNDIMNVLSSNIKEDGMYMMPSGPTPKDREAVMKDMEGKPWASVIYHKEMHQDMVMQLIRSFLVDIFLVISLIYILSRGGAMPIPRRVFAGSVALGLAFFLWGPYSGHIFFDLPWSMIKGDLLDALVAWSLCGLWLGWWLNRK
ncbi:MAG: hypothetical protein Q8941_05205 [Bacteroidota bacterium]|nr:hypothetical protein [Bacteroidota bacterium]